MRVFRIDETNNEEVKEFGSQGTFVASIVDVLAGASLKWFWFDPYSKVGSHKAGSPLIYIVINGEGWVHAGQMEPIQVTLGDCIFWDTGDLVEIGSDAEMQVIAIESRLPAPNAFQLS